MEEKIVFLLFMCLLLAAACLLTASDKLHSINKVLKLPDIPICHSENLLHKKVTQKLVIVICIVVVACCLALLLIQYKTAPL